MINYLNQNSGAILVIVAMLTLGGAGIGWVISEITDVRKDLADTERRLTEKIQANDARIAEIQQSLIRMETRIDALLDAIANHAHTEDGVVFVKPVSEQKTDSPAEVMPFSGGGSHASRIPAGAAPE